MNMTPTTKLHKILLILGLLTASFAMLPYLILGTGSIVTYHDQLDGELFSYLLTAKYLGTGTSVYPEILGGLPATGAVAPAPLFVLLYRFAAPWMAFCLSQWIINLVAFSGMYLLLEEISDRRFSVISSCGGILFMLLPFYPVYGLCIPGIPFVYLAYRRMHREVISRRELTCSILITILYGLTSSLVLVGYAVLLCGGIHWICTLIRKSRIKGPIDREQRTCDHGQTPSESHSPYKASAHPGYVFLLTAVLTCTYLVTNASLLLQVLFPETGYVSHKSEYVIHGEEIASNLVNAFTEGVSYAQSYHKVALPVVLLIVTLLLARNYMGSMKSSANAAVQDSDPTAKQATASNVNKSRYSLFSSGSQLPELTRLAVYSFYSIMLISIWYALYHGSAVAALRNSSGGLLLEFNLDRITWLLPVLWFVMILSLVFRVCEVAGFGKQAGIASDEFRTSDASDTDAVSTAGLRQTSQAHVRIFRVLTCLLIVLLFAVWGLNIAYHSSVKPNVSKLIKGDSYYALDWEKFFAEDIFTQIDEAIGEDQSSYYTLSVGIYPAAAAYNGFYCLDGYSNNYPVTYKHAFREIIAGELDKSEFVRDFFDNWGNRCYVTTAEQNNYYTFEKKWNSVIYDLQLDISKLQEMNCRYVFSAAYLNNAEELGLTLLQDAPFETEDSWYHIYVYCVPQN